MTNVVQDIVQKHDIIIRVHLAGGKSFHPRPLNLVHIPIVQPIRPEMSRRHSLFVQQIEPRRATIMSETNGRKKKHALVDGPSLGFRNEEICPKSP